MTPCPSLTPPYQGNLSTPLTDYATLVTVQCAEGYRLSNVSTSVVVTCLEGSVWNDTFGDCEGEASGYRNSCDALIFLFPGLIVLLHDTSKFLAMFCPLPAIECEPPTPPENVDYITLPLAGFHGYVYGSSVTYHCADGLRFSDGSTAWTETCVDYGRWNGTRDFCASKVPYHD